MSLPVFFYSSEQFDRTQTTDHVKSVGDASVVAYFFMVPACKKVKQVEFGQLSFFL